MSLLPVCVRAGHNGSFSLSQCCELQRGRTSPLVCKIMFPALSFLVFCWSLCVCDIQYDYLNLAAPNVVFFHPSVCLASFQAEPLPSLCFPFPIITSDFSHENLTRCPKHGSIEGKSGYSVGGIKVPGCCLNRNGWKTILKKQKL